MVLAKRRSVLLLDRETTLYSVSVVPVPAPTWRPPTVVGLRGDSTAVYDISDTAIMQLFSSVTAYVGEGANTTRFATPPQLQDILVVPSLIATKRRSRIPTSLVF